MKKKGIFSDATNIMWLLECKDTKSFREIKKIKRTFGIIDPKKVTVDHVCIYYGITKEQYWETQPGGNDDE
ncbi:MAG: hypothetical protein WC622_06480 [Pedobacter sp.]|jgi:hypothetical protein|uniref:hypothetical protein n=1 Tax=Pedobacter sp. TaxID=1411316 RepID=UPI003566B41B